MRGKPRTKPTQAPKAVATPWSQLVSPAPIRLPKTPKATLVLAGRKLDTAAAVHATAAELADDDAAAHHLANYLKRERDRVRLAERYQRERAAWASNNAEARREYMRRWRAANRERIRQAQREWAQRNYHANPEAARAKSREWYAANREAVLARIKEKKHAKRQQLEQAQQARQAQQAPQPAPAQDQNPPQPHPQGTPHDHQA